MPKGPGGNRNKGSNRATRPADDEPDGRTLTNRPAFATDVAGAEDTGRSGPKLKLPDRSVAFSGKQKREQMQAARETKRMVEEMDALLERGRRRAEMRPGWEDDADGGDADVAEARAANAIQVGESRIITTNAATGHVDPMITTGDTRTGQVRSRFAVESEAAMVAAKALQHAPLRTSDPDALLRAALSPAVPYGSWFKLPEPKAPEDEYEGDRIVKYAADLVVRQPEALAWPIWLDLPAFQHDEFEAYRRRLLTEAHPARSDTASVGTAPATPPMSSSGAAASPSPSPASPVAPPTAEINLFEQNLDVWKELEFTVRHADVVLLIADARYPAFHVPFSLLRYVAARRKGLVVALNKADLVPATTLARWRAWLDVIVGKVLSDAAAEETAHAAASATDGATDADANAAAPPSRSTPFRVLPVCSAPLVFADGGVSDTDVARRRKKGKFANSVVNVRKGGNTITPVASSGSDSDDEPSSDDGDDFAMPAFKGARKLAADDSATAAEEKAILAAKERAGADIDRVLDACRAVAADAGLTSAPGAATSPTASEKDSRLKIGLVGHPNVGKSSLINAVKGVKSVSVSATPGHTKHLQTVNLPVDGITLLDCPGLCFPSLGVPRPLQAVMGTHNIAQTRAPLAAVAYLASRLPLETIYGLKHPAAPAPPKAEKKKKGGGGGKKAAVESPTLVGGVVSRMDPHPAWTAYDMCEAFGTKRGFFIKRGRGHVDSHRAAITILQEAYAGKLVLYFEAPAAAAGAQGPDEGVDVALAHAIAASATRRLAAE